MTKDEARSSVMGAISMALKDPTLQQGFEIICKNLSELEETNAKLQSKIDDWQSEYIELENFKNNEIAELKAYNEKLLNGDIEKHNKIVELQNRNGKLAGQVASLNRWFGEAKEIIQDLLIVYQQFNQTDTYIRAEQFLKEDK